MESIETHWNEARATWATVDVSLPDYTAYVRARSGDETAEDRREPCWGDLYLACACAAAHPRAIRAFEDAFFGDIGAALARLGKRSPPVDEARQLLRVRLFAGERPKILEYSGRGSLKGWLRVVAVRVALNATARKVADEPLEGEAFAFLVDETSPEMEYMKQLYRGEFVAAFDVAARRLDDEDRALLREAFVGGLTVDAIGESRGVHRATAARWVKRAHARLVRGVRAALQERLAMTDATYESVVRLIASRLELTLERYLGAP